MIDGIMQVPYRKAGKYAGQKPDPHLTRAKYAELQAKLERLKGVQPAAIEEVKRLALMGDFSENAAYQIAKGRLRGMNQRITEIEDHLKRAEIIANGPNRGIAELGRTVTVEVSGKERIYKILGSSETDPEGGVISHNSPLGQALLGKGAGDVAKLQLPDKTIVYKIIKVE
jgi:transcription elongation factor GreA